MALTDGLKLPIPELTEAADGPAAVSSLANGVEDYLYDRILPTGVTRAPGHYWGSITVLPSGTSVKRGDTAWHSTYNVMVMYDGTNWRQCEIPIVSVGGTGVADPSISGFYTDQLRMHATLGLQRWSGSAWVAAGANPQPTLLTLNTANFRHYNDVNPATPPYERLQITNVGTEVTVRGMLALALALATNATALICPIGTVPSASRPTGLAIRRAGVSNNSTTARIDVNTDGSIGFGPYPAALGTTDFLTFDISWSTLNNV